MKEGIVEKKEISFHKNDFYMKPPFSVTKLEIEKSGKRYHEMIFYMKPLFP